MVEVLCDVEQQLLGVKDDRTERLGPSKNTDGGKRRPGRFGWGREASGMDVLHVAGLVVVIGGRGVDAPSEIEASAAGSAASDNDGGGVLAAACRAASSFIDIRRAYLST